MCFVTSSFGHSGDARQSTAHPFLQKEKTKQLMTY